MILAHVEVGRNIKIVVGKISNKMSYGNIALNFYNSYSLGEKIKLYAITNEYIDYLKTI